MTLPFDFNAKQPPPPPAPPPPPKPKSEGPRVLSVGQLDRAIKGSLEEAFEDSVWVEGEVINARPASSGHLYFSLKDEREDAVVDCAMYKANVTQRARALMSDGSRVRLRGKPTFWAPRGRLQFICDRAEAVGKGALLEALEKLKTKLTEEGLFALERKRVLPTEARVIGVVTSAGGAVIHDICRVAFRRGGARILLAPARVQGAGAGDSIRRSLAMLCRVREVEVVILARGGGGADDLSAFNEEAVVRAVAACPVPVVSAVGHEVDVSLTDFAADARAATPSQAAEMLVPDMRARRAVLHERRARLTRAMRSRVSEDRAELARLARKMGDPRLLIASYQQTKDDRFSRLEASAHLAIVHRHKSVAQMQSRLAAVHPSMVIARERATLVKVSDRMVSSFRATLAKRHATIESTSGRLDMLSPLKVLSRGYAIATRADGRAVRSAEEVSVGERIDVRVGRGVVVADVALVRTEPDESKA